MSKASSITSSLGAAQHTINLKTDFIENIEKDIEVFGDKYTFDSYEVAGGSTLDTIEINTTKKITSKTKNLDSIINELGTTIIMVTHDIDIVKKLKKRVVLLDSGRVVKDYKKGEYKK